MLNLKTGPCIVASCLFATLGLGSAWAASSIGQAGKAYVEKKAVEHVLKREAKKGLAKSALMKNELRVGKYEDLIASRRTPKTSVAKKEVKEILDAHHMPSAKYLKEKGISKADGVAMEMQPQRHAQTRTYGNRDPSLIQESPRDALARDVHDAKNVYNQNGLYSDKVRGSLQEVIRQNKSKFPDLYAK